MKILWPVLSLAVAAQFTGCADTALPESGAAPVVPAKRGPLEVTNRGEMEGTVKMIGAHAPLRAREVCDPDSDANRRVLELMMKKTIGSSGTDVPVGDPDLSKPSDLVGALEGRFSVDNKGNGTYEMTLPLPDSRGYFQPSLSVSYFSGSGSGVMGLGFFYSTGFYDSIVRGRSLYARDGVTRSRQFTAADALYLDGKRLICVTAPETYGKPGSRYRTEVDSFVSIVAEGKGDQIEGFTFKNTQGRTYFFGKYGDTEDGFQAGYDESKGALDASASTYALKRVEDGLGDFVEFHYDHVGHGEWLLMRIDFCGGRGGIAAPYEIRFLYSEYPVVVPQYSGLRRTDSRHLLDRIEVAEAGSVLPVERFVFSYQDAPGVNQKRLVSLQGWLAPEPGAPLQSLPPSTFQWNPAPEGQAGPSPCRADGFRPNAAGPAPFALGDFDGDGKTDFVEGRDGLRVHLSGSAGLDAASAIWLDAGTLDAALGKISPRYFLAGDFNGDRVEDLLVANSEGDALVLVSEGARFRVLCTFRHLAGEHSAGAGPLDSRLTVADVDGDGRDDLIVHGYDGVVRTYFSDGKELRMRPGQLTGRLASRPGARVIPLHGDVNGDGCADYLWLEEDVFESASGKQGGCELKCMVASSGEGLSAPVVLHRSEKPLALVKIVPGDFNGDGLLDVLVVEAAGAGENAAPKNTLYLSMGPINNQDNEPKGGFRRIDEIFQKAAVSVPAWSGSGLMSLDVDEDGLDDLVWYEPSAGGGKEGGWWLCASRGEAFAPPCRLMGQPWDGFVDAPSSEAKGGNRWRQLRGDLDLNGDGKRDWCALSGDSEADAAVAGVALGALCREGGMRVGAVVNQFTDGFGKSVRVAYKAARNDEVYVPGAPVKYPICEMRSGSLVVSDQWKDEGGPLGTQFSYKYSGAHLDFSGRGGLGFNCFTTLDRTTGFIKFQFLEQSFPMTGLTLREQTFLEWPLSRRYALKIVSQKDYAVTFDAVRDPVSSRLFGTVISFVPKESEYRWKSELTSDYVFDLEQLGRGDGFVFKSPFRLGKGVPDTVVEWRDLQSTAQPPPIDQPDVGFPFSETPAPEDDWKAYAEYAGRFPGWITFDNVCQRVTGKAGSVKKEEFQFRARRTPDDPMTSVLERKVTRTETEGKWVQTEPAVAYSYFGDTTIPVSEVTDARDVADGKPSVTTMLYRRDGRGNLLSRESVTEDFSKVPPENKVACEYAGAEYDRFLDKPRWEKTEKWTRDGLLYNKLFRKLSQARYENGVTASFTYDGLGRLIAISNDRGYEYHEDYGWTTAEAAGWRKRQTVSAPDLSGGFDGHSVYAVQTRESGESTVTTYFDRASRKIRVVTTEVSGKVSVVDTVFDLLAREAAVSEAYEPGAARIRWTVTTYDEFGNVAEKRVVVLVNQEGVSKTEG